MSKPRNSKNWRRWYDLACWAKLRAHQLRVQPLCRMCLAKGSVSAATIVDHIEPHRGDWNKFRLGKLQSLCEPCHREKSGNDARGGYSIEVGSDGLPVDPRHPIYHT